MVDKNVNKQTYKQINKYKSENGRQEGKQMLTVYVPN